jgi:tRNA (guanine37-N1)-methyltransferase
VREDARVQIDVVTLFPQWFEWFTGQRHVANAQGAGHELRFLGLREHTPLSGGQVDDTPFGGGAGMVLRVDVMDAALRAFYGADPVDLRRERRVIALTPGGRMLDEALVTELAAEPALTLLCGRYEGFDERIVQHFCSDAVSIGRYVLAGGELAAMVLADAVLRKLPGALGHAESAEEESFSAALGGDPEYPHYTRPADYRGWTVPEVLLSGHHEEIRRWRRARSRERGAASGGASLS